MPRYRVVGTHEVLGHAPGESFEADLDPVQERRLIAGGHIARVGRPRSPVAHKGPPAPTPPDDPEAPDDHDPLSDGASEAQGGCDE